MSKSLTSVIRKVLKSIYPDMKGQTLSGRGQTWISYFGQGRLVDSELVHRTFQSKFECWKLVRKFDTSVHTDFLYFVEQDGQYLGSFRCSFSTNLIVDYHQYFQGGYDKQRLHERNRTMDGTVSYEQVS